MSLGVIVVMISSTFIMIWKPVEVSLIKKRMRAKGISDDEIQKLAQRIYVVVHNYKIATQPLPSYLG